MLHRGPILSVYSSRWICWRRELLMTQCADPHISSQQTAPAGAIYAYSIHKANIFPFTLPPADGIQKNIDSVKLFSRKRSVNKTILTVIYRFFCLVGNFFCGFFFVFVCFLIMCDYKIKVEMWKTPLISLLCYLPCLYIWNTNINPCTLVYKGK